MALALVAWVLAGHCLAAPGDSPVRVALAKVERALDQEPDRTGLRVHWALDRLEGELSRAAPPRREDLLAILTRLDEATSSSDQGELVALRDAVQAWQVRLAGPSPLAEEARARADEFRPLGQADLQAARQELQQTLDRLDSRLRKDGENGAAWKKHLRIDVLTGKMAEATPDQESLEALLERFQGDHVGLELIWFRDVCDALRRYVEVARILATPEMPGQYRDFMTQLAGALDQYANQPSEELATSIYGALVWLDDARQAPELVAAIRTAYQQPNLHVMLSEPFVTAGLEGPVERDEEIRDCILKTSIFGTGKVSGWIDAQLVPSTDIATIELLVKTTTISHTIGYNGPARIYSLGTTEILASKRLQLDANGLIGSPAASRARTRSTTLDIQTKRGSKLVERLAWKRAGKLKGRADAIAGQHAEKKANRRTDEEAADRLSDVNRRYEDKIRVPLRVRRLFPERLAFRSSDTRMEVDGLQARGVQLASAFPAPAITAEQPDMAVQIHESMIHNITADMFAGRTIRIEDLQDLAQDTLGRIPPALELDEDREPWGITFAKRRPVSVSFDDGLFRLVLRVERFYRGDEPVQGMNVSVSYRVQPVPGGFQAARQGDVEVFPPGFQPGSGRQIPPRLQAIRSVMMRRFSKVFPPAFDMAGFVPPGEWKDFGRLQPVQVTADDQWMVLAWRKADTSATASVR